MIFFSGFLHGCLPFDFAFPVSVRSSVFCAFDVFFDFFFSASSSKALFTGVSVKIAVFLRFLLAPVVFRGSAFGKGLRFSGVNSCDGSMDAVGVVVDANGGVENSVDVPEVDAMG